MGFDDTLSMGLSCSFPSPPSWVIFKSKYISKVLPLHMGHCLVFFGTPLAPLTFKTWSWLNHCTLQSWCSASALQAQKATLRSLESKEKSSVLV